jgi:hypothetical protein
MSERTSVMAVQKTSIIIAEMATARTAKRVIAHLPSRFAWVAGAAQLLLYPHDTVITYYVQFKCSSFPGTHFHVSSNHVRSDLANQRPLLLVCDPDNPHLEVLIALPVNGHNVVTLGLQTLSQVTGNETTSASDANLQLLLRPVRLERILREFRNSGILLVHGVRGHVAGWLRV